MIKHDVAKHIAASRGRACWDIMLQTCMSMMWEHVLEQHVAKHGDDAAEHVWMRCSKACLEE